MIKEITQCRICGSTNLRSVVRLGEQYLTGVFPKSKDEPITKGPLELVKCEEDADGQYCGLLQLKHTFDLNEMYGENYGYRSGLNKSMVRHLQNKVSKIFERCDLKAGDLVLDIGSNDSTLLQSYPNKELVFAGIDPTGVKFKQYYPDYIQLIPEFFSSAAVQNVFGEKKAKVVTSIAMFYDLEEPLTFMQQVYDVLDEDGIWVFEQSYMPTMIKQMAYDTICHEHLEYYRLKQIHWMTERIGFKIVDVEFNAVNGGSFSVMVAKKENKKFKEASIMVSRIIAGEQDLGLDTPRPYEEFHDKIFEHRDELRTFVDNANKNGEKIFGYGASTKGNVILQLCDFTEQDIPCIAEVNEDKFGSMTPGTNIPIVSEAEAKAQNPDYLLVLPWHFKENILPREVEYQKAGGKMVFPLPKLEVCAETETVKS